MNGNENKNIVFGGTKNAVGPWFWNVPMHVYVYLINMLAVFSIMPVYQDY